MHKSFSYLIPQVKCRVSILLNSIICFFNFKAWATKIISCKFSVGWEGSSIPLSSLYLVVWRPISQPRDLPPDAHDPTSDSPVESLHLREDDAQHIASLLSAW